jgi:pimeloyl-[acyl-carrier protein] methyl ester esterase
VAIGHSLGSMMLANLLPHSVPLVAVNGFDRFVGDGAVAPRVLERMRSRFSETPTEVLAEFRERCGASPPPDELDEARLGADLALLGSRRTASAPVRTLSLQGGEDPILPPTLRDSVFPGAERSTHPEAGHLLPMTHPAWCAEQIEAFLCR